MLVDSLDEPIKQLMLNITSYQGIVAVGASASLNVRSALAHSGVNVPLFACGIKDPIKSGLIPFTHNHKQNIGVVSGKGHDHALQAESLLALRPDIRHALFVYAADNSALEQVSENKTLLRQELERGGVIVKDVSLDANEPVSRQLPQTDIICLFRDITRMSYLPDLVTHCNLTDTTLYASELGSVYHGAALGFGDTGYEYGWETAKLVHQYLVGEKKYHDLGIVELHSPGKLRINNDCIGRQGLHLDSRTLNLIQAGVLGAAEY